MNQDDEINGFGYVSSAQDFFQKPAPNPKDEEDFSTIKQVAELLANRRAYYQSVDSLSLDDKTFTVTEQLSINKKVLLHIQELETKITSTIRKIEDKASERE